jgi:hypothetical protein
MRFRSPFGLPGTADQSISMSDLRRSAILRQLAIEGGRIHDACAGDPIDVAADLGFALGKSDRAAARGLGHSFADFIGRSPH